MRYLDTVLGALTLLVVAALMVWGWVPIVEAKYPGSAAGIVQTNWAAITTTGDSVTIDSGTGKIEAAAGSAASQTDTISISRSKDHSIGISVTATQTVALTIDVIGSFDNTTWTTFPTPVEVTITGTGDCQIVPVTIPVCPSVKLNLSSDATYPVTYTAAVLIAW